MVFLLTVQISKRRLGLIIKIPYVVLEGFYFFKILRLSQWSTSLKKKKKNLTDQLEQL